MAAPKKYKRGSPITEQLSASVFFETDPLTFLANAFKQAGATLCPGVPDTPPPGDVKSNNFNYNTATNTFLMPEPRRDSYSPMNGRSSPRLVSRLQTSNSSNARKQLDLPPAVRVHKMASRWNIPFSDAQELLQDYEAQQTMDE
eukprot:m.333066 g.333066  ORF g.333066 m.333066 type:complete len:144 (+) comp17059_c0_seq1:229-660(+)